MRAPLRWLAFSLAAYLVAWTISYVFMIGAFDFQYYFEYLGQAWSFSGGELPTSAWYSSLILFVLFALFAVAVRRAATKRD